MSANTGERYQAVGALLAAQIAASGCHCLGLDWTVPLGAARRSTPKHIALQGNLDPAALHAPPARIRAAAAQLLEEYGSSPGHIFNLGHGIDPQVKTRTARGTGGQRPRTLGAAAFQGDLNLANQKTSDDA